MTTWSDIMMDFERIECEAITRESRRKSSPSQYERRIAEVFHGFNRGEGRVWDLVNKEYVWVSESEFRHNAQRYTFDEPE